ncbi:MAG: hypothetical protein M5U07_24970 [Xanthobacteraceae bacterium]|nr:hypothetical protein [Xanthobacteraceae bacterium]
MRVPLPSLLLAGLCCAAVGVGTPQPARSARARSRLQELSGRLPSRRRAGAVARELPPFGREGRGRPYRRQPVGRDRRGRPKRLRALLDRHVARVQAFGYDGTGTFATVLMAGEDGDLDEAMRLGRFFKAAFVHTRVARGTRCSGACALAFMGGTALRGRLDRPAVERRLEAGGTLAFGVPFGLRGASARPGSKDRSRIAARAAALTAYALETQIAPALLARIFALKAPQSFPIDTVFRAKIAEVAVEGVRPPARPADDDYISACYAQANWNYGFRGDFAEPARLRDDTGAWIDAEVLHRGERFLVVSVVVSFGGYDFWCAINTSKAEVRLARAQVRRFSPASGVATRCLRDSRTRISCSNRSRSISAARRTTGRTACPTTASTSCCIPAHEARGHRRSGLRKGTLARPYRPERWQQMVRR